MRPLDLVMYAGAAVVAAIALYLVVVLLILIGRLLVDALKLPPLAEIVRKEVPLTIKAFAVPFVFYFEYEIFKHLVTTPWIVVLGICQVITIIGWLIWKYDR